MVIGRMYMRPLVIKKDRRKYHIASIRLDEYSYDLKIDFMCGRNYRYIDLFSWRDCIQWSDLNSYCKVCLEHPKIQLMLLAEIYGN